MKQQGGGRTTAVSNYKIAMLPPNPMAPHQNDKRGGGNRTFFFFLILLTKLFGHYLKLLMIMTTMEWPLPLTCEPLACRVDCVDDEMTGRRKMKKWRGGR